MSLAYLPNLARGVVNRNAHHITYESRYFSSVSSIWEPNQRNAIDMLYGGSSVSQMRMLHNGPYIFARTSFLLTFSKIYWALPRIIRILRGDTL